LKAGGVGLDAADSARAAGQFQAAEVHFTHVHDVLTRSRWFQLAGRFPWAGTQIRAGQDLTDMGVHLARVGRLLVDVSGSVLLPAAGATAGSTAGSTPAPSPGTPPGKRILDTLRQLDPKLNAVSGELDAVIADRQRIPSTGLLPQLSNAVAQFDKKVNLGTIRDGLKKLRTDEPGIRALLGADGPRTYLVINQDPAELRATGGFIGTVGFLSFDQGKMGPFNPVNIVSIDKRPDGFTDVLGARGTPSHVDAPYPLDYVFHLQSWELRDSNWSPDFPTAARQAEFFLNRERAQQVDGVIALDPFLIQRLLAIIGPVKIQQTGDVVDQNNFYAVTLHRRELGTEDVRNSFLPEASKQILTSVLTLPPSKWLALLQALGASCDGRSLQAYFHDAAAADLVKRHNCSGEVLPSTHDALMIVESNVGGNKDDFWMQRKYSLNITLRPDGSAQHTLHLHYHGLSSHGFPLTGRWGYTGWLRVYLPPSSTVTGIKGASLTPTTELGHLVLQGWFYVQFDTMADVIIEYDESPAVAGADHALRLFWQKQAGRLGDPITVDVNPPPGWKYRAATVGRSAVADGPISSDLAVDRDFTFEYRTG